MSTSEPLFQVIIPFRDRGTDPLRAMNLARVVDMWEDYGWTPWVVSDGRAGKQQFNRSAAYNRGMEHATEAWDGFIFAESDMLIDDDQIDAAMMLALEKPGLVVPFNEYAALKPEDSELVRKHQSRVTQCTPERLMRGGTSIGAINVVSRKTMDMVGQYDERFEGNWYDDDAMKIAFEICTDMPTRYVPGRAWHLWHLPGHRGEHLTPEDISATEANKRRLGHYRFAAKTKNVARIRQLTAGGS